MAFNEVNALDADVVISIGKKDKATGKPYPKQAEGYYLGNRAVETKRGTSKLHFLSTENGNLGVWGTTDLNRKLLQVKLGEMVRITSTGTKPTPNGDMYTYKVEVDSDNTIQVSAVSESYAGTDDNTDEEEGNGATDDNDEDTAALLAAQKAEQAKKVQDIMNRGKGKIK